MNFKWLQTHQDMVGAIALNDGGRKLFGDVHTALVGEIGDHGSVVLSLQMRKYIHGRMSRADYPVGHA